jgi:6-phosphogluconolactonase
VTAPPGHELEVHPDAAALVEGAANRLAALLARNPWPRLVLAGGRTPLPVYSRLAGRPGPVGWERVRFTFGDERCVPPDHPDSNYGAVKKALFDPLGTDPSRVIRIRGEDPPGRGAEKAHRALVEWAERVPLFDVVLFGLGADGHVASLFPAGSWPSFGVRLAAATRHPGGMDRVTLTPAALRSTGITVFLVSGEEKAPAVRDALTAGEAHPGVPSRMVVEKGGRALWLLDRAAASLLPARS